MKYPTIETVYEAREAKDFECLKCWHNELPVPRSGREHHVIHEIEQALMSLGVIHFKNCMLFDTVLDSGEERHNGNNKLHIEKSKLRYGKAEALEAIAKPYNELLQRIERQRSDIENLEARNKSLYLSNVALRAWITRLKNKMKKGMTIIPIFITAIFLASCAATKPQYETLDFAQAEYEKIIQRDSLICEYLIEGKLSINDARMLIAAQSTSVKVLHIAFEGMKRYGK